MTEEKKSRGPFLFLILIVFAGLVALLAYNATGTMGIEERFNSALGLETEEEEDGGGFFGLALEGNIVLYGIILGILLIGSYAAYRYSRSS